MNSLPESGFLSIGAQRLEYRWFGPRPEQAPTLVLLHEGLGCVDMWGSFPERLSAATGCGVFVYSRGGYGQSSPATLPRPLNYMTDEARDTLPEVLGAIGFRTGLLVGHSDGASISAIYAGSHQDHRVGGLVLIAPHFVCEDITNKSIAAFRKEFEIGGDLRPRLARWHANVDATVRGWSDVWLGPDFRRWDISEYLAYIRVPVLIVQGVDDQYGTVRQIEIAQEECYCPVEVALLPGARHSPQREAPEATFRAVTDFVERVMREDAQRSPIVVPREGG